MKPVDEPVEHRVLGSQAERRTAGIIQRPAVRDRDVRGPVEELAAAVDGGPLARGVEDLLDPAEAREQLRVQGELVERVRDQAGGDHDGHWRRLARELGRLGAALGRPFWTIRRNRHDNDAAVIKNGEMDISFAWNGATRLGIS